jgi:hypothetical protein
MRLHPHPKACLGVRWGMAHAGCQPFGLEGIAMVEGVEDEFDAG